MSVTFKFGKVDRDSPGLNVMDSRQALAGHSPLALRTEAVPYQIKFPMWFRQNQQQQVLREVARRFNDLTLQWHAMDIPDSDTVWGGKGNQADRAHEDGDELYNFNMAWPAGNEGIVSQKLNPQAVPNLDNGNYKLKLHVDEREYELGVAVSQTYGRMDNNREILQRLAIAINSSQSQVKATLQETVNPSDPMAPYRIPGRSLQMLVEGQARNFYLEDTQGQLAAAYGLKRNQPAAYAHNAQPGNGPADVDELVGFTQNNGRLQVSVPGGPQPLLNAVRHFLFTYNELVDYVAHNSDYLRPSLKDRLIRPQQDRADSLSNVGLKLDQQGHITPGRDFTQNMLGDYKTTSRQLLKGEHAWAGALLEQITAVEQIGLENYANPLLRQSEEQVRSRAWMALDSLREHIISAYY